MKTTTEKLNWLLVVIALGVSFNIHAQNFNRRFDIPVMSADSSLLKFPWVGGLNSVQVNTLDLNGDGTDDIVAFDRFGNKVYTFVLKPDGYSYEPQYEHLFPETLQGWLLLRDFNHDGKKDIFTGHIFGVLVFVNTTKTVGNELTWRPFNGGEPLETMGFSGSINLKVNLTDVPSIDDMDGDGDLDILTPYTSGNSTLELHRNQSVELNQNFDSLQMVRQTQRWGDVEDCTCGQFEFNGESCFGGGRTQHSGGKSVISYDVDQDGDRDLFYSDEFCSAISLLRNEGTSSTPLFQSAEPFLNLSAPFFPMASFEDLNADGLADFIVSSGFSSRSDYQTDFTSSIWKYTGQLPSGFNFVQSDFLQHDMIDVGDDAVPAFADADGDGDLDLFAGSFLTTSNRGGIFLYENIGTSEAPEFKLINADYAQFSNTNLVNIKPSFVDLNRDGKKDLAFTATDFNSGQPGLYYIENKSASAISLDGEIKSIPFNLLWDERATFTDFNSDGDPDIIKGTFFGAIELWINNGGNQFSLTEKLNYLSSDYSRTFAFCTVADINFDGKDDLLIGGSHGYLELVYDYKTGNSKVEDVSILNLHTDQYEPVKLAGRLFPTVVRLFNTSIPQIVTGTSGGGLVFLYPEDENAIPLERSIQLYPNPVSKTEVLHVAAETDGVLTISNALGQIIMPATHLNAGETYHFNFSNEGWGVYLAKFTLADKQITKRVIVK